MLEIILFLFSEKDNLMQQEHGVKDSKVGLLIKSQKNTLTGY